MENRYPCPYCWQSNEIELFPEDGVSQLVVTDCEICCQPILIHAAWHPEENKFHIAAEREAGD